MFRRVQACEDVCRSVQECAEVSMTWFCNVFLQLPGFQQECTLRAVANHSFLPARLACHCGTDVTKGEPMLPGVHAGSGKIAAVMREASKYSKISKRDTSWITTKWCPETGTYDSAIMILDRVLPSDLCTVIAKAGSTGKTHCSFTSEGWKPLPP